MRESTNIEKMSLNKTSYEQEIHSTLSVPTDKKVEVANGFTKSRISKMVKLRG